MSALVPDFDAKAPRMTDLDLARAMANVLTVDIRLNEEPERANTDNCERTLRTAATAIMGLWAATQDEKMRRREALVLEMEQCAADMKAERLGRRRALAAV